MRTLIVDGSNLTWISAYVMSNLTHGGKRAGVFYGFLKTILHIGEMVEPNLVVITWDGRHNKRKQINPNYKANRDKVRRPEDELLKTVVFEEIEKIRGYFDRLGIKNNFTINHLEADDVIASIVQKYKKAEHIILSADSDLYQLLDDNVKQISPRDSSVVLTKEAFVNHYGIEPKDWVLVKAIAGDRGDNVIGIPKIGEKTALKYLKGQLKEDSKQYKLIEENKDLIQRNLKLVKLPLETIDITLSRGNVSFLKYRNLLDELKFRSLMTPDKLQIARKIFRMKT